MAGGHSSGYVLDTHACVYALVALVAPAKLVTKDGAFAELALVQTVWS